MRIIRQSGTDLLKAAETKDVVFFGAGAMALRLLNTIDIADKVKFICENEKSRIGSQLCGIDIVGADALKTVSPAHTVVVVASRDYQIVIGDQIQQYGDFDTYFARSIISEVFEGIAYELYDHQRDIETVTRFLLDDTSKDIYRELIRRRMLYGGCDFSDLIINGDEQYILPQMFSQKPPSEEIIVDCGAFTGDTLEKFTREFNRKVKKIWAFECGKEQLDALNERAARLRKLPYCPELVIMPYALSDTDESALFYQCRNPSGSFVAKNCDFAKNYKYDSGICTVEAVRLDSVIPPEEKISFIKMDVEGSEYNALSGAKEIIKKHRPKLAISIYHSGADFYRLPLLIKALVPEYNIAIRHHNCTHRETCMYAWI